MSSLTLDQLLASFPDNTTGQITPENLRDFVSSVELKYDNWTVVKPGQPNGNKFPDPDGGSGKIELEENTVWVVNGDVNLQNTLLMNSGVVVQSLTGDFSSDSLTLDTAAGAIPLFENVDGTSFAIKGLGLSNSAISAGGSGRLFAFTNTNLVNITSCALFDCNLGTWDQSSGDCRLLIDSCLYVFVNGTWSFTGSSWSSITFNGNLDNTQSNVVDVHDLTGVDSNAIVIKENVYRSSALSNFILVDGDNNIAANGAGIVANNIQEGSAGGVLISGVDKTSIEYTFSGNSGFANSQPQGGIVQADSLAVTVNPGLGTWTTVAGDGSDVLTSNSQRFSRTGDLELTYDGKEEFDGEITVSLSARRSGGGGAEDETSFSVSVNAVPLVDNGVDVFQFIDIPNDFKPISFSAPLVLQEGDVVNLIVRKDSGANDIIVTNVQMLIK